MVRVIKELRPTWVVGENVTGIIKLALPDILFELETCGYRTRVFHIPASGVGARHHRYRVAIVGYSEHSGEIVANTKSQFKGRLSVGEKPKKPRFVGGGEDVGNAYGTRLQTERTKQQTTGTSGTSENVQYTDCAGRKEHYISPKSDETGFIGRQCDEGNVCNATGERLPDRASEPLGEQRTQEQESERPMRRTVESVLGGVASRIPAGMDGDLDFIINHYWDEEPSIPRIATGIEHRVDRLKCLGNAVVPQQFYPIFKAIAEVEKS